MRETVRRPLKLEQVSEGGQWEEMRVYQVMWGLVGFKRHPGKDSGFHLE